MFSLVAVPVALFVALATTVWWYVPLVGHIITMIFPKRRSTPFVTRESVVLLTGATCPNGIGLRMAREYYGRLQSGKQSQIRLILVGRATMEEILKRNLDAADKEMLRSPMILYIQADLSKVDCGDVVASALMTANVEHVDVVVQLAGVGWVGPTFQQSEEGVRKIVNVNLRGPILLARRLLPFMRVERNETGAPPEKTSKLVFVSSVKSQVATPFFSVYTATKAAVDQLAVSLQTEFGDSSVCIQLLHPGATKTGFFEKCGVPVGAIKGMDGFPSPDATAAQLLDSIDFHGTSNLRSLYGTAEEKLQFMLGWLMPQHYRRWLKRWSCGGGVRVQTHAAPLRIVITGGSNGIGQALTARMCEQQPHRVLSFDIDAPQDSIAVFQRLDLAADDLQAAIGRGLAECFGQEPVDLLCNNAGVNFPGRLSFLTPKQIDLMIRINVVAPILMTNACAQHNEARGVAAPALCFVSSMSHYFSYPGSAVYGATKDAVSSYAKSLGYLLAGQRPVLTVYPGPTDTSQAAAASPARTATEEAARKSKRMPPSTVATHIWDALAHGKAQLQPGPCSTFARKAALDPMWARRMMRDTQLIPLVAKHKAENNGDAGL